MTSSRSQRGTYVAAFVLGALIALLIARPVRSAEPFPLDRAGIAQLTDRGDANLTNHPAVPEVDRRVTQRAAHDALPPAEPDSVFGRNLMPPNSCTVDAKTASPGLAGRDVLVGSYRAR